MRTVLVDDDKIARRSLRNLLAAHPQVEIVGEAGTAEEAVEVATRLQPDLLFMDIRMGNTDGFSIVAALDYVPEVIFVSSYSQYAVRAFEVKALDYLRKPVNAERLALAISRLPSQVAAALPPVPTGLKADDLMLLRNARKLHAIAVQKIAAVAADGNFTRVFLVDEQPLFLRRTLSEWETLLPQTSFLRADRTLLINLAMIQSVSTVTRDKSVVRLRGVADTLELGRTGSARLRGAMQAGETSPR